VRVLCTTPYYEPAHVYGGPARSIPALCRALAAQGVDVTVFTTNANGSQSLDVPVGRPLDRDGVEVTYFKRWTRARHFWSPGLARACLGRAAEFDAIHTNGIFNFPSLVATAAASANGVPLVLAPRGELMPWALGYKGAKKAVYLRLVGRHQVELATALLCTDAYERQAVEGLGFGNQIYVVPNGLDTSRFAHPPPRGGMRRSLGLPDEALVILSLGRLHPIKRPDLVVGAFARIADRFPRAHLLLAGPDEAGLEPELSAAAGRAGCAERVRFLGLLDPDQVLQSLADADLFVMTSESENFGMAAAEAMAAGLPVVISEKVGLSRYIAQTGAGQVVSLEVQCVAQGLATLLQQPEALGEMGLRARQVAVEAFDLTVVAQKVMEAYAEVTRRPTAQGKEH
jgi:glycosyltransferase involved in cell wall biosynthesis